MVQSLFLCALKTSLAKEHQFRPTILTCILWLSSKKRRSSLIMCPYSSPKRVPRKSNLISASAPHLNNRCLEVSISSWPSVQISFCFRQFLLRWCVSLPFPTKRPGEALQLWFSPDPRSTALAGRRANFLPFS